MPVARRYNSFAAAQPLDLSLGNLHFGVAAWLCRVHRGSNAAEMQTHYRPLRVRKHQNGDLAASQVLLMLDILVCREQYLEAGRTSGLLHKLLHRRFPEPPEMHQNGCITPRTQKITSVLSAYYLNPASISAFFIELGRKSHISVKSFAAIDRFS